MNQILRHLPHDEVHIIAGGARSGADKMAEKYAKDYGYKFTRFPADWDGPYRRGAGYRRNAWMADVGTHLVAFHDGESPGTKQMIDLAMDENRRLVVQVYRIKLPIPNEGVASCQTAQKPRSTSWD